MSVVMNDTIQKLSAPKKGVLAADESTRTIGKRFDSIGVENTQEHRQAYRELLFTTEMIEEYISGVILYEETFYQKTKDGVPFVELLAQKGILSGIKVDAGVAPLGLGFQEETTQGLDGLAERCKKYFEDGARFAKWRATYTIDTTLHTPSELAIKQNAASLARYAAICQEHEIVPIVEPEVLMDGSFSMEEYADVTRRVQHAVFQALQDFGVSLEHIVLKPNMIIPSSKGEEAFDPAQIATMTLEVLRETVPASVPAILFLSGGQSEEQARDTLASIHAQSSNDPWFLSFSYGRALQTSTLQAWKGDSAQVPAAQKVFLEIAQAASHVITN